MIRFNAFDHYESGVDAADIIMTQSTHKKLYHTVLEHEDYIQICIKENEKTQGSSEPETSYSTDERI